MLKAEEAAERIKQFKAPKWVEGRLANVGRLPERLREPARAILGREPSGKSLDWDKREKRKDAVRRALRGTTAADRRKIFEALFGDLAPHVEGAWQMFARLPYESGYERKAFRAPNLADALEDRRLEWASSLCTALEGYAGHQGIEWVAAWAPHLGKWGGSEDEVGLLLAAAIDAGGPRADALLDLLKDFARGQHDVGGMGRHVTRALMTCSRPDAWEFIEKLLLAAQRQEGLRQAVLETIDMAHPQAFRRMLRLILENNLARFAATVRAIDVWFGFQWDSVSAKKVDEVIERVLEYLDNPKARKAALDGADAEQAFLALWSIAFEDAEQAIPPAARMLKDPREGKRFVAAHLLYLLDLDAAKQAVLAALDDADLRVVARALDCFSEGEIPEAMKKGDLFERLEKLITRVPEKKTTLKPIVWPWWTLRLSKEEVADVMEDALGDRPPTRLIPHLEHMSGYSRSSVVGTLAKAKKFDAPNRQLLLKLITDNQCREEALAGLAKCKITPDEAARVEGYLTRKNGDLRRGALGLLEGQADAAALDSADRLLASRDALQRLAGLELLRRLVDKKRAVEAARQRARAYQGAGAKGGRKPTKDERVHLDEILDESRQAASLDDALGLLDPASRTPPADLKPRKVTFCTKAARQILDSLDELIHQHREETVFIPDWRADRDDDDDDDDEDDDDDDDEDDLDDADGPPDDEPAPADVASAQPKGEEKLLGNVHWEFPSPRPRLPLDQDLARLPLRTVWAEWWANRPTALRDRDGLELLRALWLNHFTPEAGDDDDDPFDTDEEEGGRARWLEKIRADMLAGVKPGKQKYGRLVTGLLAWTLRMDPPKGAADFLLDGFESALAMIPPERLAEQEKDWSDELQTVCNWREDESPIGQWKQVLSLHQSHCPEGWAPPQRARLYRLLRWWDEPTGYVGKLKIPRSRPDVALVADAFAAGACAEADVIEHLLGPRSEGQWSNENFEDLANLTAARPSGLAASRPALADIAHRCRRRVIEVELKRGDSPTAATKAAKDLNCSGGLEVLAGVFEALGKDKLTRGTRWGDLGKPAIFSHLIRASVPGDADTPDAFAAAMRRIDAPPERLVEVAVYAPQWAGHVEAALGWPGLADAVWWMHAHTRDRHWSVERALRRKWDAAVRQRTPLPARDLLEGAVDVGWFRRAHRALGADRWDQVYDAAKYASSGTGHSRARLFSDAMLARVPRKDLLARVRDKRNQDAVRALGLLPLADGPAADKDLHERYKVLQEFVRTARQFGSMRQASEKRAAAIGMENLARAAGYPDPVRLQWAMEAEETRDLAAGPVKARAGDVVVELAIDADGQPQLSATNVKTGRTLASVPAAAKKKLEVADLLARKTDLRRTASRVRQSLEAAMVRGDVFTGAELTALSANPLLRPLLARVVFVGEGIAGYPVDGGRGLAGHSGKVEPVKKAERLRIAHPLDLLQAGDWDRWQHDCFARERVQPFKQVFRELYVPTKAEKGEGAISRRYAGHQLNPRQAIALLTGRGWVAAPEEGVFRTFHDAGLVAWLTFQESFYTPAEVDGLTLEGVRFARRGDRTALPVKDVPPRLFSEVMRDLDLVVSVAHRGGVDPEASASTVEMRAALLRETCALLKLDNVRIKGNHALVRGKLASYTVHLGSAVAHRQPGGALYIVAVHSQHRGRLFLPFADDDPKTAEVISKVLLLARDQEIQDPNLLAQIRA